MNPIPIQPEFILASFSTKGGPGENKRLPGQSLLRQSSPRQSTRGPCPGLQRSGPDPAQTLPRSPQVPRSGPDPAQTLPRSPQVAPGRPRSPQTLPRSPQVPRSGPRCCPGGAGKAKRAQGPPIGRPWAPRPIKGHSTPRHSTSIQLSPFCTVQRKRG